MGKRGHLSARTCFKCAAPHAHPWMAQLATWTISNTFYLSSQTVNNGTSVPLQTRLSTLQWLCCRFTTTLGPTLRCVWSPSAPAPHFLGLVWVPNPGKSVGPGVTQWAGPAPNLLLSDHHWWLITSDDNNSINSQWTLNNENPHIRSSVSFSLITASAQREEIDVVHLTTRLS